MANDRRIKKEVIMIHEVGLLIALRGTLRKLDIIDDKAVDCIDEVYEYADKHGKIVRWQQEDDELDESNVTDEELRIMNVYDKGYREWFETKFIDSILLDDDD